MSEEIPPHSENITEQKEDFDVQTRKSKPWRRFTQRATSVTLTTTALLMGLAGSTHNSVASESKPHISQSQFTEAEGIRELNTLIDSTHLKAAAKMTNIFEEVKDDPKKVLNATPEGFTLVLKSEVKDGTQTKYILSYVGEKGNDDSYDFIKNQSFRVDIQNSGETPEGETPLYLATSDTKTGRLDFDLIGLHVQRDMSNGHARSVEVKPYANQLVKLLDDAAKGTHYEAIVDPPPTG